MLKLSGPFSKNALPGNNQEEESQRTCFQKMFTFREDLQVGCCWPFDIRLIKILIFSGSEGENGAPQPKRPRLSNSPENICDLCNTPKPFSSRKSLIRHKKEQHEASSKLSCDQCRYTSRDRANMGTHRWRHEQGLLHKCDSCHRTFSSVRNLARHRDDSEKCQAEERKREVERKQADAQLPVKAGQRMPHADGGSSDEEGNTDRIQPHLLSGNSVSDERDAKSDSDDIEVVEHFPGIQIFPVPFEKCGTRISNAPLSDSPIGEGVVLDSTLASLNVLEKNIDMQRLVNSDMDAYLSPGTLPGSPEKSTLAPFIEVNQHDDKPLDLSQG